MERFILKKILRLLVMFARDCARFSQKVSLHRTSFGALPSCFLMWKDTGFSIFEKAYAWSEAVNQKISTLPLDEKKLFSGAAAGLSKAHSIADVAVISTANRAAILEEWGHYDLLQYTDLLLCQDSGNKSDCIAELLKKGYSQNHVLMIGDAPGDCEAAEANGAFFYPIQVRKESESWLDALDAFEHFAAGSYEETAQRKRLEFEQNLRSSAVRLP